MTFLYQKYDNASKGGFKNFRENIPDYITRNLKHSLRPYQEEAIGRYLYYKEDTINQTKPEQILYNMATGSGKTVLMAAIILEKFYQGERNFIFFVNNDNILTKTRDNFLNLNSDKYLFADKIEIGKQIVNIREVTDFSDPQPDSINILFTTIQKLHLDLNTPKENRPSYEQFKDISVVLLADEAHHLNAGLNADEKKDNTSWTHTIENIQLHAKKSSIFEFTATIDLTNPDIAAKYAKSLLFKYDLKEFRLDKYSKDVLFHLVDSDVQTRMLQAIIISQYRKKIALKHGINLKPLILFKSQKIAENKINLELFLELLQSLKVNGIEEQKTIAGTDSLTHNGILKKAFDYFEEADISFEDLIAELQEDFRIERLLLIDGNNKTSDHLTELNTLEQTTNEIRAVFAVDMLNEGWDVLNLFDIVRLYDTRDGKTTRNGFVAGKTTNAEKQLIGRGARYYPFVINGNIEEKYIRKFDNNELNELRVIEQLHYHSANNPRYISELKQVLRESGIYDDVTLVERTLSLKPSFKQTRTYTDGVVWVNKRVLNSESKYIRNENFDELKFEPSYLITLPTNYAQDYNAFVDEEISVRSSNVAQTSFKFGKVIDKHIVRHAMNCNKHYTFDRLRGAIFGLGSISGFISMLSDIEIVVEGSSQEVYSLSQQNKLYIAEQLLSQIESKIISLEEKCYGTNEFTPYPIKDLFEEKILRKYTSNQDSDAEAGVSQKEYASTNYYEDIDNLHWYAYDDNFGTSEEKLLVRTIKLLMTELEEKWTDIYLLRNEKAVRIYNFEDGRAFEPDFLLFANDKQTGNVSWQLFIEPKGSQFKDKDDKFINGGEGWKEQFLNEIAERDKARTLIDNDKFRIVGLPFFNDRLTKADFKQKLLDL
ncbi:DEAD/DEAH box helicase family protein [Aerococcaceae bacterium NML210727]|nr:DEAD/DEAH box helicase family protein [Aerococcaceae bacterium NML210727]MCW6654035.1 DEAD/DEAH box helicase family protein [Aerococcaceae bacterium NML201296]MCW6664949.1 DEAD/DEAH box helicase family protein [Aerococcaceae bacterium NML191219]